ncbi:glucosamine inositolphosphorylceramide transferase family protein [Salinimicrobium flavum]|uniref:Glucosamine inositolphosphorylceramide transferase 1 N-terminal domain-containing protein n=1 Tax=Salinimicrobium flavum TaxID=1737065 RepID=A0ABW5IWY0_9FLAO
MNERSYKKVFIFFAVFTLAVIVFLLLAHNRYSFFTSKGGGWSIGYRFIEDPLRKVEPMGSQVLDLEWLDRKTDQKTIFLADPFVIHERDTFFVFFEHQGVGNANIGLLQSHDGYNFIYKGEVLDEKFHLSFPNVFKYQEDFYMLPETKQAGHILLYKAEDFPYNWKIYDTLITNVHLKDPALLMTDSLKVISASDHNLKQHLFTSKSLEGPWVKDPAFQDRQGDQTRAGGNFFKVNNSWYLPFQKNNDGYGTGLALYQFIVEENQKKFVKVSDSFLESSDSIVWFNRGMHHLSLIKVKDHFYTVFDGDVKDTLAPKLTSWKASLKYNYYDLINLFR